jgi:hypothetical protein
MPEAWNPEFQVSLRGFDVAIFHNMLPINSLSFSGSAFAFSYRSVVI